MWGDYHARELSLLVKRMGEKKPYYRFFFGKVSQPAVSLHASFPRWVALPRLRFVSVAMGSF
jgi:hypothetical protein